MNPLLPMILRLLVLVCWTTPLVRADQSGLFTYEVRGAGIAITGYPKDATGDVVVPPSIAGMPVTAIGDGAFAECRKLTSVTLPEGVTFIGYAAFIDCSSLVSIALPQSLTTIGDYAFGWCSQLTSVTLPEGVTFIGYAAFTNCSSLVSIALPQSLTNIPPYGFRDCTSLVSISIPENVSFIATGAFWGCTGLVSATIAGGSNLPDVTRGIGWGAFSSCTRLASLTIGSGVATIEDHAFGGCVSLTSVSIPDTVATIGWGAFSGCSGLATISIGSGVTSIGLGVFSGCTSLDAIEVSPQNQDFSSLDGVLFDRNRTTLMRFPARRGGHYSIPVTVQQLQSLAFEGCAGLTSIAFPDGLATLGSPEYPVVITECPALTRIDVDPSNPHFSSLDGVLFDVSRSRLIRYPEGRAGAYAVPDGVISIGVGAFEATTTLTSVSLPASLATIGFGAFNGCSGLTSITIPPNVTTIDSLAFSRCIGLTSLVVPDKVLSLGIGAFSLCTGLETVSIGRGLTEFGSGGFGVFGGCTNLLEFRVHERNTAFRSIDGVLFSRTPFKLLAYPSKKPGSYTVPAGVTGITAGTFDGCAELTSVTIPGTAFEAVVPSYGGFQGCRKLRAIEVVDPLNTSRYFSRDGVFFYRDHPRSPYATLNRFPPARSGSYQVPEWVTWISTDAFEGCSGLGSILFSGNAPSFPTDTGIPEFPAAAPGFTVYYFRGKTGFTSPTWRGYPAVEIDPAVHPAAGWLLGHGLPYQTDLQEDPNGDGISLLLAYALDLDPHQDLSASLPVPVLGEQGLSLSFHGVSPGITYRAETSSDLLTWSADGVILSPPGADGRRTASVPRDAPARYLRLSVAD